MSNNRNHSHMVNLTDTLPAHTLCSTVRLWRCIARRWPWRWLCVGRVLSLLSHPPTLEVSLTLTMCWRRRAPHRSWRSVYSVLITLVFLEEVAVLELTLSPVLPAVGEQLSNGSGFQGAAGKPFSHQASGWRWQGGAPAGKLHRL